MVIEALKAARDFIESDRQDLAESLTVNGAIVFEDDTDRRAMAEYVNVLVVIDGALEQALAAPTVQDPVACHICGGQGFIEFDALPEREKNNGKWGRCLNCQPYTTPPAAPVPLTDDTRRLDALAKNSWDLRCFDMSDDDIGWRVIEHHMQRPHERKLAEVFRDDPRQAIDAAIEAAHGITKGQP